MTSLEFDHPDITPIREARLLPRLVVEQLRNMVQDGDLPPGSRLPSEPELAKALNISRSTLRAALSYLESEGTILRRRGVGTFVADRPSLFNKLNVNWGVTQIIQATGAKPGTSQIDLDVQPASRRMAEHLKVSVGEPILLIERVRTADDKPVSISVDHVAMQRIQESIDAEATLDKVCSYLKERQSIYLYFREVLGIETGHATAWLRPMVADVDMAKKLDIPQHTPILYMEQIDHDIDGNPLLLTDEYFVADTFIFSVHRSP